MALIICPECNKKISSHAQSCPNCGMPLKSKVIEWEIEQENNTEREKREFLDSLGDDKTTYTGANRTGRKIKETKYTCKACGNIWYYGKQEVLKSAGDSLHNLGKDMMCCTGCAPALLIPNKKEIDLNKCPNCGSKAIIKRKIIHEV